MKAATNYLDFMACMLLADGVVDDNELTTFVSMLQQMGAKEAVEMRYSNILREPDLLNPRAVIASVARFSEDRLLHWIIRDSYIMAASDGDISKEEIALVDDLLTALGIPESQREAIHQWGRELTEHIRQGQALLRRGPNSRA